MFGQVWDLRTLKLQRCVPCLDSTSLTWNASGDCAYATLRRPSDDLGALLHPKRAKHPLHAAFRTVRNSLKPKILQQSMLAAYGLCHEQRGWQA